MEGREKETIWTIGHSTRTIEAFIAMLESFHISVLADIRKFPGSRRYPHFNKPDLERSLQEVNIRYLHYESLGGRRKPRADSVNTVWRHAAFKGYADYMETEEFHAAIFRLEGMAMQHKTAYMCSEAVWWRCHRSLVSDYLKVRGWTVMHITERGKVIEHPYTSPARPAQGKLFYD